MRQLMSPQEWISDALRIAEENHSSQGHGGLGAPSHEEGREHVCCWIPFRRIADLLKHCPGEEGRELAAQFSWDGVVTEERKRSRLVFT